MAPPPLHDDILVEIVRRLPVKSLIQFRSVSKAWKSLIDSYYFVSRYTGQHHVVIGYDHLCVPKFDSIVDDGTLPPPPPVPLTFPPLLKTLPDCNLVVIGSSYGVLCLYCDCLRGSDGRPRPGTTLALLWNPCVRKVVHVVPDVGDDHKYVDVLGFGVCSKTANAKIVKVTHVDHTFERRPGVKFTPMDIQVFSLSQGAWRKPYGNLPCKSF
ncbi:F-box protein At2g21930-like [Bidens hawaiensis]|uniref:F-box protein At2g21930-like n=1 Tax=Bidens hawaiensis TaxID=980011 RepID=UPI00404A8BBF